MSGESHWCELNCGTTRRCKQHYISGRIVLCIRSSDSAGWALKKKAKDCLDDARRKTFLVEKFNSGSVTGLKADPVQVNLLNLNLHKFINELS